MRRIRKIETEKINVGTRLDTKLHGQVKALAALLAISVEDAIAQALHGWIEAQGLTRALAAMDKTAAKGASK